jgi:hypothetical protein
MRVTFVGLFLLAGSVAFGQTNAPTILLGNNGTQFPKASPQAQFQFNCAQSPNVFALPPGSNPLQTRTRSFSMRPSLGATAKAIPIPTQWPNAKMEAIPTQWPNLKVVPIVEPGAPAQIAPATDNASNVLLTAPQ